MTLLAEETAVDAGSRAMARVVTLTPAPSIDRMYPVPTLDAGGHHRVESVQVALAGKGVNLSRALAAAGGETRAVFPLNDDDRRLVLEDLRGPGFDRVTVPWHARQNIVITSSDGTTTNLNSAPHPLSAKEWERLTSAALEAVVRLRADWLVIAGTFPRQDGTDAVIDVLPVVAAAHGLGARVAVDTSGAGLRSLLDPTVRLDLIKPNRDELAELVRRPLRTIGDVADAARTVRATGIDSVLVSLGRDGALLVRDELLWAPAPVVPVANTTGAGDALLAGFLSASAGARSDALALRRGVAWGSVAVQQRSPHLQVLSAPSGVALREPRLDLPLR